MPKPQRVISLCPSLTELVFRLGAESCLVGITRYCIHPAEGVAEIEKVGGTKDPDLDRIRELEPDLVLLNREENRREDAEALAGAGLACHSSDPHTIPETVATLRDLGLTLDCAEPAEDLALAIERAEVEAKRMAAGRDSVSFAYLIWRKPWMTANDDTYIHDLLTRTGGRNVFAKLAQRYPRITEEDLAEAAPSLVLLSSEPFPFTEAHADELARSTGLDRDRFRLVDGEMLSWHGSRTLEGIGYAAKIFAGEARDPRR
jgi:iron complex transport system substrate-binding protein